MLTSCAILNSISGSKNAGVSTSNVEYSEDLSIYSERMIIDSDKLAEKEESLVLVPYEIDVTDTVNAVLDSIAILNINRNTYTGYSIQLFSSNDYEEAKKMMGKALKNFAERDPILNFQQPNFKIKIGKFNQEITARSLLNEVKDVFPSAIIVPETYLISEMK